MSVPSSRFVRGFRGFRFGIGSFAVAGAALLAASAVHAQGADPARAGPTRPVPSLDSVEVTESKLPTMLRATAASVTVVSGEELRARGARDLRTALAFVPGVEVGLGSDDGPAGAVPAFWGLREFDAFLLLVDGIPRGGAFTPALATLDLGDVDRIEVVKGAAPVSFGATSFVGIIHVLHHAAGEGSAQLQAGVGSRGQRTFQATLPFPDRGNGLRSSLQFDGEQRAQSSHRSGYDRAHALYRGGIPLGAGDLTFDLDGTLLRQDPLSPHPRDGAKLSARTPLDANVNPRDGKIDENRVQLAIGYGQETPVGEWSSRLSGIRSDGRSTRGFLREDFAEDGETPNADGFRQKRELTELYFDTHVATPIGDRARVLWGLDYTYGKGSQRSANFEYALSPTGHGAPNSHGLPIDENTELEDRRNFAGLYGELQLALTDAWRIDAGLRLNRTLEKRSGEEFARGGEDEDDEEEEEGAAGEEGGGERRRDTRWSGSLGTSYRLWSARDGGSLTIYANHRDTFKPAVIDFGPEAEADILRPESAVSNEVGLKGEHAGGRLAWDLSLFRMNFRNLVVTQSVDGLPGLTNAGKQRFKGLEFDARYALTDSLRLQGTWAYHDARFGDSVQLFGDTPTQLRGNFLELSPRHLASAGLLYADERGLLAHFSSHWVGQHFLNKRNTARVSRYTTFDAGFGFRRGLWEFRVDAYNLTDRRNPVAESELGEAQYYRMPGRSWLFSVRYAGWPSGL